MLFVSLYYGLYGLYHHHLLTMSFHLSTAGDAINSKQETDLTTCTTPHSQVPPPGSHFRDLRTPAQRRDSSQTRAEPHEQPPRATPAEPRRAPPPHAAPPDARLPARTPSLYGLYVIIYHVVTVDSTAVTTYQGKQTSNKHSAGDVKPETDAAPRKASQPHAFSVIYFCPGS